MMDEQSIRQWAWEAMEGYGRSFDDGKSQRLFTSLERMQNADELAAWVMSGKLPDTNNP